MKKGAIASVTVIAILLVVLCAYSEAAKEPSEAVVFTVEPAKTAFVLLHWQNDLVSAKGKFAGDLPNLIAAAQNIENAQAALNASRENGVFVIYVSLGYKPGYPEFPVQIGGIAGHVKEAKAFSMGSWGAQVVDELKPLESEPVIYNSSSNAFCYTDLEMILRNRGITHLVVTGMVTNFVVESTAREAMNRCFAVTVLEDCCNGFNRDMHNWAMKNILPSFATIANSKAYIDVLGKAGEKTRAGSSGNKNE